MSANNAKTAPPASGYYLDLYQRRRHHLKASLTQTTQITSILRRLDPPPLKGSTSQHQAAAVVSERDLVSFEMEIAAKELCAVWSAAVASAATNDDDPSDLVAQCFDASYEPTTGCVQWLAQNTVPATTPSSRSSLAELVKQYRGTAFLNPTSKASSSSSGDTTSTTTVSGSSSSPLATPQLPPYRLHDELRRVAETPIRDFYRQEVWEQRTALVREVLTATRQAEAAAFAEWCRVGLDAFPLASRPKGYVPWFGSEDRFSFVQPDDAIFVRVWQSAEEARCFTASVQRLWQCIFENGLAPCGPTVCAMMFVQGGIPVTFATLPPLAPTASTLLPARGDTAPSVLLGCCSWLLGGPMEAAEGTRCHVGGDGRWHILTPTLFGVPSLRVQRLACHETLKLIPSWREAVEREALQAQAVRAEHPPTPEDDHVLIPPSVPHRYEWVSQLCPGLDGQFPKSEEDLTTSQFLKHLIGIPAKRAAEALLKHCAGSPNTPLVTMLSQLPVTNILHNRHVPIRWMYFVWLEVRRTGASMMQQQQQQPSSHGSNNSPPVTKESMQCALDLLEMEMVLRTFKAGLRVELTQSYFLRSSSLPQSAEEGEDEASVSHFRVELLNRLVQRLLQGSDAEAEAFWTTEWFPICRQKFALPEPFRIPFRRALWLQALLWYLTGKFGAVIDKTTKHFIALKSSPGATSGFFGPPDSVKLLSTASLRTVNAQEILPVLDQWFVVAQQQAEAVLLQSDPHNSNNSNNREHQQDEPRVGLKLTKLVGTVLRLHRCSHLQVLLRHASARDKMVKYIHEYLDRLLLRIVQPQLFTPRTTTGSSSSSATASTTTLFALWSVLCSLQCRVTLPQVAQIVETTKWFQFLLRLEAKVATSRMSENGAAGCSAYPPGEATLLAASLCNLGRRMTNERATTVATPQPPPAGGAKDGESTTEITDSAVCPVTPSSLAEMRPLTAYLWQVGVHLSTATASPMMSSSSHPLCNWQRFVDLCAKASSDCSFTSLSRWLSSLRSLRLLFPSSTSSLVSGGCSRPVGGLPESWKGVQREVEEMIRPLQHRRWPSLCRSVLLQSDVLVPRIQMCVAERLARRELTETEIDMREALTRQGLWLQQELLERGIILQWLQRAQSATSCVTEEYDTRHEMMVEEWNVREQLTRTVGIANEESIASALLAQQHQQRLHSFDEAAAIVNLVDLERGQRCVIAQSLYVQEEQLQRDILQWQGLYELDLMVEAAGLGMKHKKLQQDCAEQALILAFDELCEREATVRLWGIESQWGAHIRQWANECHVATKQMQVATALSFTEAYARQEVANEASLFFYQEFAVCGAVEDTVDRLTSNRLTSVRRRSTTTESPNSNRIEVTESVGMQTDLRAVLQSVLRVAFDAHTGLSKPRLPWIFSPLPPASSPLPKKEAADDEEEDEEELFELEDDNEHDECSLVIQEELVARAAVRLREALSFLFLSVVAAEVTQRANWERGEVHHREALFRSALQQQWALDMRNHVVVQPVSDERFPLAVLQRDELRERIALFSHMVLEDKTRQQQSFVRSTRMSLCQSFLFEALAKCLYREEDDARQKMVRNARAAERKLAAKWMQEELRNRHDIQQQARTSWFEIAVACHESYGSLTLRHGVAMMRMTEWRRLEQSCRNALALEESQWRVRWLVDTEATLRMQTLTDAQQLLRTLWGLAAIPWAEDNERSVLQEKEAAGRQAMEDTLALLDRIQNVTSGKVKLQYRSLTRPSQKHLKVLRQQRVLVQQHHQKQLLLQRSHDDRDATLLRSSLLLAPLVSPPRPPPDTTNSDTHSTASSNLPPGAGLQAVDQVVQECKPLLAQLPVASPLRSYLVSRLHAVTQQPNDRFPPPALPATFQPPVMPLLNGASSPDRQFFRDLHQLMTKLRASEAIQREALAEAEGQLFRSLFVQEWSDMEQSLTSFRFRELGLAESSEEDPSHGRNTIRRRRWWTRWLVYAADCMDPNALSRWFLPSPTTIAPSSAQVENDSTAPPSASIDVEYNDSELDVIAAVEHACSVARQCRRSLQQFVLERDLMLSQERRARLQWSLVSSSPLSPSTILRSAGTFHSGLSPSTIQEHNNINTSPSSLPLSDPHLRQCQSGGLHRGGTDQKNATSPPRIREAAEEGKKMSSSAPQEDSGVVDDGNVEKRLVYTPLDHTNQEDGTARSDAVVEELQPELVVPL